VGVDVVTLGVGVVDITGGFVGDCVVIFGVGEGLVAVLRSGVRFEVGEGMGEMKEMKPSRDRMNRAKAPPPIKMSSIEHPINVTFVPTSVSVFFSFGLMLLYLHFNMTLCSLS
jgi:hypothetical protein